MAVAIGVAVTLALAPSFASASRAAKAAAFAVTAAESPSPTQMLGVNTGVLFNSRSYTQAQIDSQLAALAQTGAKVVRSDALWENTEPNPPIGVVHLHRYDWSFDDLIVHSLAAHGLQWFPIIDYTAPWDESVPGQVHSPPLSVSDYAAYAAALAARYGPGGLFWIENPQLTPLPVDTYEIWNEPDNPVFWHHSPDAATYASLYTGARAAITAVQPAARVIVGGLMHPVSFLSAMLAAAPALAGQIDGVAIHPYAATPADVLVGVRNARLAMRSHGLASVPLYVTEFGWTTRQSRARDSAPEQARPGYISSTISTLGHTDCGIAAVLLYAWATPERDPANAQDWFGISPPGAGGSPDTAAFASGLHAAAAPGPTVSLCAPDTVLATRTSRPARRARPARHRPRSPAHRHRKRHKRR